MKKKTDPPLSEGVRKCMVANKSKGTSPEIKVRLALRNAGYPGYRLNWKKTPGKPDICYPGKKIAIFVNGCFWHRCKKCNLPAPKHNSEYWKTKLDRNVKRDAEEIRILEESGWKVITVWECELKQDFESTMKKIIDAIESVKNSNK